MMVKINPKVVSYLTSDEKTALSLQFGMEKSTWEAGEIMSKSHYKYLEIKYRGEYLIKFFTSYVRLYDCLIPPPSIFEMDEVVRYYFMACLERRLKVVDAIELMREEIVANPQLPLGIKNLARRINKAQLNERITKVITAWQTNDDPYERSMLNLVKEFDRWNNFRILPKELQEPSAFKRRIKKNYLKHLEVFTMLNPLTIRFIKRKYKPLLDDDIVFFPCLVDHKPKVLTVKPEPFLVKQLSSVGLYLFRDVEKAHEYLGIVTDYVIAPEKSCKVGLEFWPKYRAIIQDAINYMPINNINPSRKYLRMAINKQEFFNQY